jgi:FkbM family methyltransferase
MPESHEWLDYDAFEKVLDYANYRVVTVEVSQVPCARKGCCTMLFNFRPGTTDKWVFKSVFQEQFFGPIYEQLGEIQPEYILDGGGNVGFAAALFAMVYPHAKIISVEPDRENFAMLTMNTLRYPNVHAVHAGLWDKNAHIGVKDMEGEWGYMFEEVSKPTDNTIFGTTITQLMEHFNFPRLDFVKIDIEGAEVRVFNKTANLHWLDNAKLISIEVHDRPAMENAFGVGPGDISRIVTSTMEKRPFIPFLDGEHIFYQHNSLTTAHARNLGEDL